MAEINYTDASEAIIIVVIGILKKKQYFCVYHACTYKKSI